DVGDNHVVARAPIEPVGHGNQTFGRVLHEGDLVGASPDQRAETRLDAFVGVPAPVRIVVPSMIADVVQERLGRVDDRVRQWTDGGVVQVASLSDDRKLVAYRVEVQRTDRAVFV